MPEYDDNSWHLDKRVPIALVLLVLAQFGLGIWYISHRDAEIEGQITAQNTKIVALGEKIKESNDDIASNFHELKERLDKVPSQIPPREVVERLVIIENNQRFLIGAIRQLAENKGRLLVPEPQAYEGPDVGEIYKENYP